MLLVFCVGLLIAVSGTHARCSKSRIVNSSDPKECGRNSHYNSCGTDCPLTCDNYKNPPQACDARCNPGCECDEGFVKAPSGQCVQPKQCPRKALSRVQSPCGPNSHYDQCATACPKTCDNYNQPQNACNAGCAAGCKCNDGYILTKDGRCVAPNQCPAPCGPNSHYDQCVTACPKTCDNYNQPQNACNAGCGAGCKCNDGYVLTKDGSCVAPNQCPVTCAVNEFYTNCVNPCNNCSQKGYCNNYPCYSGCDCFRGYYRNNQGTCVPEQQCPAAQ